jgi:hypothetical protein
MIVAPPGSFKTELFNALDGLKGIHLPDHFTPQTLISGYVDKLDRPTGLLHRIGEQGVIIFSDFSTILSMPVEKRGAILADLRRVYDGRLEKQFGTALQPSWKWKGRITFLAGATPDVDKYYAIFQSLGERFVMVRCDRVGGPEVAMAAMRQDSAKARRELTAAVHGLFAGLPHIEPVLPNAILEKLGGLAEFVALARTHVPRDGYKKMILDLPQAEAPTRIAKQLAQLSKGAALLEERCVVSDNDYDLAWRVGWDCIPRIRYKILDYAVTGDESDLGKLPPSTRSYADDDLRLLGLITGSGKSVKLSEGAGRLLAIAGWS